VTDVAPGVHAIQLPATADADTASPERPYVYWVSGTRRGALINVGYGDDQRSLAFLDSWVQLTAGQPPLHDPPLLLLTDHYGEHVDGATAFKTMTGAEVALGRADVERVQTAADETGLIDTPLDGGEEFDLGGGTRLLAIPTPGHTPGSISYLIRDQGVLFTGDFILGTDTSTTIDPDTGGDMTQHIASLYRAREFGPKLILSFHGAPVSDPQARIGWLLERRKDREDHVVSALEDGVGDVDQIRDRMYEGLGEGLRDAARRQVVAHLMKLVAEERAESVEPGRTYRLS
jgi:glyoxylase-like metal-dependent hydrolase (beta-lactamase superfamily II)